MNRTGKPFSMTRQLERDYEVTPDCPERGRQTLTGAFEATHYFCVRNTGLRVAHRPNGNTISYRRGAAQTVPVGLRVCRTSRHARRRLAPSPHVRLGLANRCACLSRPAQAGSSNTVMPGIAIVVAFLASPITRGARNMPLQFWAQTTGPRRETQNSCRIW